MKKRVAKSLKLNKQTVMNLDSSQMNVYGGASDVACSELLCHTNKCTVGPCADTGNCHTQESRATYCDCQSVEGPCPGNSDFCPSFIATRCNGGACW
ncbi:MAG: hypothetical protein GY757_56865 [bacterium]|nr:hypothetical protein [bacterium]